MRAVSKDLERYRRALRLRLAHWRAFLAATPQPGATRAPASWLRPKGNISRGGLLILLVIAVLPLLVMILRVSSWPGVLAEGGGLLQSVGHDLNTLLSLRNIAPSDRDRVLYLLFVPTGAVLIALARITFGVRVIGFRSILLSIGFQHSGIVASMILIAVVVAVVLGIHPLLTRVQLTRYARAAVILSVSVLILVLAFMAAPWFRSELLWSVAFFPVIALGLMTEGIAKTVDRDSGLTAMWRAGMTIAIALVLAGISQVPVLREIAIEFPELVITQIVVVILIAEFLDLRLLQDWDARLSGMAPPRLFSPSPALRLAVVRNRHATGIIARLGAPARGGYRRRSVSRLVECLRQRGHSVIVVEGDMTLLGQLRDFMPAHPMSGLPGGLVVNLAHGIQGDVAAAHVPAMLEMSGLAYTGPTPLGQVCAEDRIVMRTLLRQAGLATPEARLVRHPADDCRDLLYPVVVGPRAGAGARRRIARNRQQLLDVIARLTRRDGQQVVVEPLVAGKQVVVPVLGNAPARCLPIVGILPGRAGAECPAALDAGVAAATRAAALKAYRACNGRDFALVEVCVTPTGTPVVMGVDASGALEQDGPFEIAARAAGLSFTDLLDLLIDVARERYRPEPEPGSTAAAAARGENRGQLVAG
jgi:D-alanine-D-alanine ligase